MRLGHRLPGKHAKTLVGKTIQPLLGYFKSRLVQQLEGDDSVKGKQPQVAGLLAIGEQVPVMAVMQKPLRVDGSFAVAITAAWQIANDEALAGQGGVGDGGEDMARHGSLLEGLQPDLVTQPGGMVTGIA